MHSALLQAVDAPTDARGDALFRSAHDFLRTAGNNTSHFLSKTTPTMAKREYIEKNRQWLADKAQETGVNPLPKGIYYKVIASGDKDGRKPSARSVVTAHYTGRTINGRTFDSSRGGSPLAARLSDLITGWSIAMQQMHVGDRWEVYIPAEMAYGKLSQPGIPGGSTLIFDMELLSVY